VVVFVLPTQLLSLIAIAVGAVSSVALVACSSTSSDGGPGLDGSSTADGSQGGAFDGDTNTPDASAQEPDSAGRADADGAASDGSLVVPSDGATGLDGPLAFGVHYSVLVPQNLQTACGYAPGPSTGYGDVVVIMTDVDVSGNCASGFAGPPPAGAVGHPFVRIEVASPSYGRGGAGLSPEAGPAAALAPGSSMIGYENVSDPDSCMLAHTGGTALLDLLDFGDAGFAQEIATSLSGTVTLTAVETGHVAGDFDVLLARLSSGGLQVDAAAPFTGHFDTTTCPGTKQ
jgi:hypothetical protein